MRGAFPENDRPRAHPPCIGLKSALREVRPLIVAIHLEQCAHAGATEVIADIMAKYLARAHHFHFACAEVGPLWHRQPRA